MELTKKQRNDVFNAIVAGKLDPATCEIEPTKTGFDVMHLPTGSRFETGVFSTGSFHFISTSRVGTDPPRRVAPINWSAMLHAMSNWVKLVIEWEQIPDLWATRRDWKSFVNLQEEASTNASFTSGERETISSQLKAINESIKKTNELTAAQEAKIDEHFKEAEEASRRLGRKDWTIWFMGGVFSLVLADVITPDIFQHILMMAFHGLEHIFLGGNARSALGE